LVNIGDLFHGNPNLSKFEGFVDIKVIEISIKTKLYLPSLNIFFFNFSNFDILIFLLPCAKTGQKIN
jgi:hypothetical protein